MIGASDISSSLSWGTKAIICLGRMGRRASNIFPQEHPDEIVLDLKMREMDGLTVLLHHVRTGLGLFLVSAVVRAR